MTASAIVTVVGIVAFVVVMTSLFIAEGRRSVRGGTSR
jgi:hypothetical protein